MTDLEKINARLEAVDAAIASVKTAMSIDRKMSHDKHQNGHYTKALTELTDIKAGLSSLKVRIAALGR